MSKIYQVTFHGRDDVDNFMMIVEFGDYLSDSEPEPTLENMAKSASEKAIRRRWDKVKPGGNLGYFVRSFSVEPLPDADLDGLTASGIGPYNAEPGVLVWMARGPWALVSAPLAKFGIVALDEVDRTRSRSGVVPSLIGGARRQTRQNRIPGRPNAI